MDRLNHTRNAAVALKCLMAVHHIIKHGSFILQDQLSVYPASGGRNYLNLSKFRDDYSASAWELSSWARWLVQFHQFFFLCSWFFGILLLIFPNFVTDFFELNLKLQILSLLIYSQSVPDFSQFRYWFSGFFSKLQVRSVSWTTSSDFQNSRVLPMFIIKKCGER